MDELGTLNIGDADKVRELADRRGTPVRISEDGWAHVWVGDVLVKAPTETAAA